MKHITKSIALLVFFVIMLFPAAPPARADVRLFGVPYEFTLSAETGFMYGTAYEIVYRDSGSDDYVSELQWNIKPLLLFGLDFEFGPKNPLEHWGLFAGIKLKAGIPAQTGVIEDRDWLSDGTYYHSTVPGSLTLFSSHENHTTAAFLAAIETGVSLPLRKLILRLYLNVDYMYFSWEARNGYTQYGENKHDGKTKPYVPWNPGFAKKSFRGLGISYVQHWILFTSGIGGEIPAGRFTFSADVFFGVPICIAIDDHHRRVPPFRTTGILAEGIMVKSQLGVSFYLSRRFDIGLSAACLYIGETRGNSYVRYEGDNQHYSLGNVEGARFKAFLGSLTLTYHL